MARITNALLLLGCIALWQSAGAQPRSSDPASLPVLSSNVTPGQFKALSADQALKTYSDPRCVSLRSLVASYDALRRFYTPNTMARNGQPPRTVRPHLPVQDAGAAARATIAADLAIIGRDVPEWSTELLTIEIATLVDASGQTARRVVAGIPKTAALVGITKTGRERCEANGEQGCDSIAAPD